MQLISSDVVFSATLTAASHNIGAGVTMVYPNIISNIGDAYNDNNGIFTIPSNGTYNLAVITMSAIDQHIYSHIMVNNEIECTAFAKADIITGEFVASSTS